MRSAEVDRPGSRWWLLFLLQLVLIVIPSVTQGIAEDTRTPVPAGDSPALGPKDAPVTIVKFTDYQ